VIAAHAAWTLRDGRFDPGAEIPVADRGFRYGMSVFETVAVCRGRMLFRDEHLWRLRQACSAAQFALPPEIDAAAERISLPHPEGMLRLYVTAGEGTLFASTGHGRVIALFEPVSLSDGNAMAPGFSVVVSRVPAAPVLGGWKTGNYWSRVQALRDAHQRGAAESLIFSVQGTLVSASMANVFVVLDGRVCTPALADGARDGVVRNWLLSRRPVEEWPIMLEDLDRIEECFLTNSRLGVMPVTKIEGRDLPSSRIGSELAARYREEVFPA